MNEDRSRVGEVGSVKVEVGISRSTGRYAVFINGEYGCTAGEARVVSALATAAAEVCAAKQVEMEQRMRDASGATR